MTHFDVIVVGGGHAGTEAAAAASRRGANVVLVTFDAATIGAMSCNPAIGGVGKGHIVREIDAMGGLMARAADAAAIHHRMLNRSKGVAVHGPRVQADRQRYATAIQSLLQRHAVTIVTGEVDDLIVEANRVGGVRLRDGSRIAGAAVVLAAGTFLGGRLFRGRERLKGGRVGERAATRLGGRLRDLSLPIARMKTGTPPRLDGRTIDWGALSSQLSDRDDWTMSAHTGRRRLPQVACAITHTNAATHEIIRAGGDTSPLLAGDIAGPGPRYCPSVEDKVRRFADRDAHQIFLEPEGLDSALVYPNGISTSLSTEVQQTFVRSIAGLERAEIVVPGYAVEYDHIDPRSLSPTLELRDLGGLFCCGQINGTTGYEEAAGQGLIAGANAAASALGRAPLSLSRHQAYLGVMIDDLTLQGVTEPYRMLTARAEHRLALRADNAEARLSGVAATHGLIAAQDRPRHEARTAAREAIAARLDGRATASEINAFGGDAPRDGGIRALREWVGIGAVTIDAVVTQAVDRDLLEEAAHDARYAPYVERQRAEAVRASATDMALGPVDYAAVPGLSSEMQERLTSAQPATLEDAARIRGMSPAAITAVLLHVKRRAA